VRPLRLAVRTSPSHGENTSSILVGVTNHFNDLAPDSRYYPGNLGNGWKIDALKRREPGGNRRGQSLERPVID
jgi:hypothetical protein